MTIQIDINRYTIKRLELAIEKYNKESGNYRIDDYVDIINRLLEKYLNERK